MGWRSIILCASLLLLAEARRAMAQPAAPIQQEDPVLGAPADIVPTPEEGGLVWLDAGTRIRQSPSLEARSIAVVDVRMAVPVVDRLDDWILVRFGGWKGWVPVAAPILNHRDGPQPTSPDRERLDRAREILNLDSDDRAFLGPFELHTDVTDRTLLLFLRRIAEHLPNAYHSRYGIDPGAEAREAVVIFSRRDDYRAFARKSVASVSPIHGLASHGLAVIFVGRQSSEEVGAILTHELIHLLNRRVFTTPPYPWLEEGLANDLSYCRIEKQSGELQAGSLGGRSVVIEHPIYLPGGWSRTDREIRLKGPVASLTLLQKRQRRGRAVALNHLLDLLWEEFIDPLDLQMRYDQSAFFVRYLLDGDKGHLAAPFRAYLRSLTTGQPADPATLLSHLGRSWQDLEAGFAAWLQSQTVVP